MTTTEEAPTETTPLRTVDVKITGHRKHAFVPIDPGLNQTMGDVAYAGADLLKVSISLSELELSADGVPVDKDDPIGDTVKLNVLPHAQLG